MDFGKNPRLLLWVGVAGLLLTCVYTVWLGGASAARLQERVQTAAQKTVGLYGMQGLTAMADGQAIRLEGVVPSEAERDRVAAGVLASLGPGGVVQGGVTAVRTNGVVIAPPASPFAWSAHKEAGKVTLEGAAPSQADMTAIEEAARRMFPDAQVTATMKLASGAPVGLNWRLAALQGLEAMQPLLRGSARLVDRTMTISGTAPTEGAVGEVSERVARMGEGVIGVAQVTGPPEWTARLADGNLSFSGRIATAAAQRSLARAAGANFRGQFRDEANVGVAGPFAPRALAAMAQFSQFKSGEMAAQGRRFYIRGEAPESVLSYLKDDMAKVVDTYTVEYDVTVVTPELPEIAGVDLTAQSPNLQESCQDAFQRVMSANKILFGNGNARITRQSGEALDKVAEIARRCSAFKLQVEGYTDNRGRRAANVRLSQQRADAVMAWLKDKGVPAAQLSARGRGPDNPVANNRNESGRAQNRRIEFRVSR